MPGSISPWPLVRQGDRDHPVRTLQDLLRARSYTVVVDGVLGPETAAAVRAFQQEKKLAVDGIAGTRTWSALVVQVKKGSTDDAVRGVQEGFQFRNLSGDLSKGPQIDGISGPRDRCRPRVPAGAVRGLPGVVADGIVGPVTWRALVSGMLAV
jgi:peptidoglycan hydrolase-like protein with peptidoglycan-binding domain